MCNRRGERIEQVSNPGPLNYRSGALPTIKDTDIWDQLQSTGLRDFSKVLMKCLLVVLSKFTQRKYHPDISSSWLTLHFAKLMQDFKNSTMPINKKSKNRGMFKKRGIEFFPCNTFC